jgi:hypothetical protein
MAKAKNSDKILTVQVHHENLNPRTFRIPLRWIRQASTFAWLLLAVSVISSVFAVREYYSERSARPELVNELENEIQELKIALEKKAESVNTPVVVQNPHPQTASPADAKIDTKTADTLKVNDPKASDEKPAVAPGESVEGKDGVWAGLAENISLPPAGTIPTVKLEDAKLEWQGKYVNFTANVLYREPGKGSQQGHIVALSRSNDRIFAHPEGVLNVQSPSFLFDPNRGEYFSVARFRVLKTHFGPFETAKQLAEIQVYLFDLNNKLILTKVFRYGK